MKTYEYTIVLGNGTEIRANLNANTWETDEQITESTFEGGLDGVSYEYDGETIELGDVKLVFIGESEGEVWFGLNPLTDAEKKEKELLAVIEDLNDQITEIQEALIEEV